MSGLTAFVLPAVSPAWRRQVYEVAFAEVGSQRACRAGQARESSKRAGCLCLESGARLTDQRDALRHIISLLAVTLNVQRSFFCCFVSLCCRPKSRMYSMAGSEWDRDAATGGDI